MGCLNSKGSQVSQRELDELEVLFFDCDDTLYQNNWATAELLKKSIDRYTVEELGLDEDYAYQLYLEHGTALRGLLKKKHLSEDLVEHFLQDVHNVPLDDIKPNPELREMILSLGNKRRFVFTASIREHALRCLERVGIADLFEDIIDCRDCGLMTKHDPMSFTIAMEKANVADPTKCMIFDDSTKNIETGRKIGFKTCLVGTEERETGLPIVCSHADFQVRTLLDVPTVIPGLFPKKPSNKTNRTSSHSTELVSYNSNKTNKSKRSSSPSPEDEVNLAIFVLGGPGCGKGTQCKRILDAFPDTFEHISAGDLLREEQQDESSKYGELIRKCITEGTLVPSELTMKLLVQAFKKSTCSNFLVDGCPRDIDNYECWKKVVEKPGHATLIGTLFFDADEDILLERILGRAKETQGSRADDNAETAKKRFKTFRDKTMPLIDELEKESTVVHIDASKPIDEVFDDTKKHVAQLLDDNSN